VATSKPNLDSTRDTTREIDLDEVAALIDALERDLQKIQGDSQDVQRLKDEVETLKNLLQSPVRRHHWVRDALHGIRERFDDALDTAVAGGVQASRYIAEIGRILGM
jgi:cell division septum initiation protein DivIVA